MGNSSSKNTSGGGHDSFSFRSSSSYESHKGNFLDHSPLTVRSDCNNAFSSVATHYNSSSSFHGKSSSKDGYINSSPLIVRSDCANGFAALATYHNPSTPSISSVTSFTEILTPQITSNAITQSSNLSITLKFNDVRTTKEISRNRVRNKLNQLNNYSVYYTETKETIKSTIIIQTPNDLERTETKETTNKNYMKACLNGLKEGHENYFLLNMGSLNNPMNTTENATNDSVGQIGAAIGGCVGGLINESLR